MARAILSLLVTFCVVANCAASDDNRLLGDSSPPAQRNLTDLM
jgi:hypothetical protein